MKIIVELETDKLTREALLQIIRQMDDESYLTEFAKHYDDTVKTEVAANPHTLPVDLDNLSKEDYFMIKWCVAANERTTESDILRLANDKDFLIRERISERYDLSDKVLMILTRDEDDKIRELALKKAKRRHI